MRTRSSSLTRALDALAQVKSPPKKEARIKGTKKTTVFGITFDSKREAEYYLKIRAMKDEGMIFSINRQVKFELVPGATEMRAVTLKSGRIKKVKRTVERPIYYIADFVLRYANGDVDVVDCKGYRTEVYRIKRKLMLHVHGIRIKEV